MNELNRVDSEVSLTKLTEQECAFISGGIDLKVPAAQIFEVVGQTTGKAVSTGLSDLFLPN